jgi:hypothetical protein
LPRKAYEACHAMERLQAAMAEEEAASAAKAKVALKNRTVLAARVKRIMQVLGTNASLALHTYTHTQQCSSGVWVAIRDLWISPVLTVGREAAGG